jgi:SpoIIAA-like
MIKALENLPEGVIGFETSGKLEAEDYRDVLIPAIEGAAAAGKVRVVVVIDDFGGLSGGALWEDLKLASRHFRSLHRFALVTDSDWMRHFVAAFGWMIPGEIKYFPMAERTDAVQWAEAG